MADANHSDTSGRDSVVSVSSVFSETSTTINYPSIARSTRCGMYNSKVSLNGTNNGSSAKVTIVSEARPVLSKQSDVPLERLLDFDNAAKKVPIKCSKYKEIGNPHARKGKALKRLPSSKKWNQKISYTLDNTHSARTGRDSVNFMDKQSSSIYNTLEKARMDTQLISRKKQNDQLVTLTKRLAAPQIHWYYLEAIQRQRQPNICKKASITTARYVSKIIIIIALILSSS